MAPLGSVADTVAGLSTTFTPASPCAAVRGARTLKRATRAVKVDTPGWPPRCLTKAHNSPQRCVPPQTRAWGQGQRGESHASSAVGKQIFSDRHLSTSPPCSGFHSFKNPSRLPSKVSPGSKSGNEMKLKGQVQPGPWLVLWPPHAPSMAAPIRVPLEVCRELPLRKDKPLCVLGLWWEKQ